MRDTIHELSIKVYGIKICIKADTNSLLGELKNQIVNAVPVEFEFINDQNPNHIIYVKKLEDEMFEFYKNGESFGPMSKTVIFEMFISILRVIIAEFAVKKVILHAGVVAWNGKAIVIPGKSFRGKTTLVSEFVKKGAIYYSDDFAVLNKNGFIQSFPKALSMRGIIDDETQVDYSVESMGGRAGKRNIAVGMILLTEFEPNLHAKQWKPKFLSAGQGILEIIPHTVPIRNNTKFALNVLNKVASRAIIVKSRRGEAKEFVDFMINFFENNVESTRKKKTV